jgi:hypothetical protein
MSHICISLLLVTTTNLKCNGSWLHKPTGIGVAQRSEKPDDSTSCSRTVTSLPKVAFSKLKSTRPELSCCTSANIGDTNALPSLKELGTVEWWLVCADISWAEYSALQEWSILCKRCVLVRVSFSCSRARPIASLHDGAKASHTHEWQSKYLRRWLIHCIPFILGHWSLSEVYVTYTYITLQERLLDHIQVIVITLINTIFELNLFISGNGETKHATRWIINLYYNSLA